MDAANHRPPRSGHKTKPKTTLVLLHPYLLRSVPAPKDPDAAAAAAAAKLQEQLAPPGAVADPLDSIKARAVGRLVAAAVAVRRARLAQRGLTAGLPRSPPCPGVGSGPAVSAASAWWW